MLQVKIKPIMLGRIPEVFKLRGMTAAILRLVGWAV